MAFSQDQLNQTLKAAADSSRVQVDASIYKDYALAVLFFKYLSDKSKAGITKLKERFGDNQERIDEKMKLSRFYLPKGASFDDVYVQREQDNIGEILNKALHAIEDQNDKKLRGIFGALDFNSEAVLGKLEARNRMVRNLLNDFKGVELADTSEDIIGNSYMYLIEQFGSDAGKKAGEFYSPVQIAELVARLARPRPGDRICDPTVGSGGLLLLAGKEVQKQGSNNFALYGQESKGSTYQLCRMNMYLHGMDSARIEWGDTLNEPQLVENDHLMKFDIEVANPPFSLDKWGYEKASSDKYNRFWRGIPPKTKGDYAFISHMVETLKPKTGRMAVIVPHGVLFRGSSEGRIREGLIKENLIDAVIGLPAGLFQTTGIPVAILVIDRAREKGGERENEDKILFIEASKEYKPGKAMNSLEPENADKIFNTFNERKEIERFSRLVPISEIAENDYNLNITRYVDTFEPEPEIDIKATLKEIAELKPKLTELEEKMNKYLKELGIE